MTLKIFWGNDFHQNKNLAVSNLLQCPNTKLRPPVVVFMRRPPADLGHENLTLLLTRNTTKVPCIPPSHFTAFCVCPPPSLHEYIFMLGLSLPLSLGGPTSSCVSVRPRSLHDLHNRDRHINKVLDTTCIACISGSVATTPFLALCCRKGS